MHRAAVAKVMVRRDHVRDGVRVERRRREHAARARRGPPGRVHATQLAASAVEHPPATLGVQVSERGVEVCRGGVRVVSQRGHEETGVLDGRNAGRYGPRGRVERGVRKRQREPWPGMVGRGLF